MRRSRGTTGVLLVVVVALVALAGCGSDVRAASVEVTSTTVRAADEGNGPMTLSSDGDPVVRISTSMGDITAELDAGAAPVTVQNFLDYVRQGFYDGTIFHRVIPGFMIQGGGFTSDMRQKPTGPPIKNEADNGLTNSRGTLAMARTQAVDSATAQFFINVVDNDFLDHKPGSSQTFGYAVFGKVVEGMDVVDAIVNVPTATVGPFQDVPKDPVVIESVTVVEPQ